MSQYDDSSFPADPYGGASGCVETYEEFLERQQLLSSPDPAPAFEDTGDERGNLGRRGERRGGKPSSETSSALKSWTAATRAGAKAFSDLSRRQKQMIFVILALVSIMLLRFSAGGPEEQMEANEEESKEEPTRVIDSSNPLSNIFIEGNIEALNRCNMDACEYRLKQDKGDKALLFRVAQTSKDHFFAGWNLGNVLGKEFKARHVYSVGEPFQMEPETIPGYSGNQTLAVQPVRIPLDSLEYAFQVNKSEEEADREEKKREHEFVQHVLENIYPDYEGEFDSKSKLPLKPAQRWLGGLQKTLQSFSGNLLKRVPCLVMTGIHITVNGAIVHDHLDQCSIHRDIKDHHHKRFKRRVEELYGRLDEKILAVTK